MQIRVCLTSQLGSFHFEAMCLTLKAAVWHPGPGPGQAGLCVTVTASAWGVVVAVTKAGRGQMTCLIPKANQVPS